MYLIVLGRRPEADWRKTRLRHFELGHARESMLQALFGSSEFRARYHGYHDVADPDVVVPGEEALEPALRGLGASAAFVDACYVCLLGRDADPGGRDYSLAKLEEPGGSKSSRGLHHLDRLGALEVSAGIFEPDEVRALIDLPSLGLVEPIDDRVWSRDEGRPVNLRLNRHETPHMLVEIDGTVFTSVTMFLRKRPGSA